MDPVEKPCCLSFTQEEKVELDSINSLNVVVGLSESEDMGLKIKVAHFLCENLHILVEELQKEAIKAIEEGLFKEGVPDPKIVEGVLSFDNWQTFRRCLTNPFLKVAVEDFAAKNDLDQYRNYLTRNGEKKCLEKK